MAKLIRLACSIIALTAFVVPIFADEPQKISVDETEASRPYNDKGLSVSAELFEINQSELALAGLTLGTGNSVVPYEMDSVACGRFVEFLKLAQSMKLVSRISHPRFELISGYTSTFKANIANSQHLKLEVSPYIKDGAGKLDMFVELDSPVSLASTDSFARRTRTVAQSFDCKVGTSYLFQNPILEDHQSGKSYLFLITLNEPVAAVGTPRYWMQVRLYKTKEKNIGNILEATQIKLFEHFDGTKDQTLVDSTLQLAEDQLCETVSGGSQGTAPMQIDFGTHIKLLATKPQDGLIPIKLDLDLREAVDDPNDHNTLKTRGRTVSISTQLVLNQKKTIKVEDKTWCELKIGPSSGIVGW